MVLGLPSCIKENSFENATGAAPGGSSSFTLVPSGANCSDATIVGVLEEGLDVTANVKMTLTVNVTKAGSWTYSTASVNGIVFAGAGDFANTGNQELVLLAVGKPAKQGNYIAKLNIGGIVCNVPFSVAAPGSGGGGSNEEFYYKATIGGVNYFEEVTLTNDYEAGSGNGGLDEVVVGASISYANPPLPKGKTEMYISKGIMRGFLSATNDQFKAFFTPGDYPFASEDFRAKEGVAIYWTDPNGETWSTRDGRVDQSGSTFKIISTVESPDALGRYYLTVKMQFNCKLYNENTGAMKELKNGEMSGSFGKF